MNKEAILQQKSFSAYSNTSFTIGSYEKLILQFEKLTDQALEGQLKPKLTLNT